MGLPLPLPVEREQLVIAEIVDGLAITALVHLPAHRRLTDGPGGPTFDRYEEFSPHVWPSACRQVDAGYVYVHDGLLAGAPVCLACEEAVA